MGKFKVLHICDKFGVSGSSVHGISRLFSWWYPRFDEQRFETKIYGLRPADEAFHVLLRQGVDVTALGKSKYDFSTVRSLLDVIQREKPHLLHLHGYGATTFGRIASKLSGVKNIVHEHFVDPNFPVVQKPFDRLLAGTTDHAIAVSASVKDFMVNQRYLPAEKVDIIYNGAPVDAYRAPAAELVSAEKRRNGLVDGEIIVGTIGRLDEQKGLVYFLEAAAQLKKKGIKARYFITGDGPLEKPLKEKVHQLGLENEVTFTGFCPDVRPIQAIFDIQVFPSLWEGTPLTVFEAMAMGKTILSTDVDGLGEVLEDGKNALLVPARDPDRLAQALETLITDPQLSHHLARQSHADSKQYDIQNTIESIQNLYEQLLGG